MRVGRSARAAPRSQIPKSVIGHEIRKRLAGCAEGVAILVAARLVDDGETEMGWIFAPTTLSGRAGFWAGAAVDATSRVSLAVAVAVADAGNGDMDSWLRGDVPIWFGSTRQAGNAMVITATASIAPNPRNQHQYLAAAADRCSRRFSNPAAEITTVALAIRSNTARASIPDRSAAKVLMIGLSFSWRGGSAQTIF